MCAEAAPEIQYGFIEQALRGGGPVLLRCSALGAPPPTLLWLRDELPLEPRHVHNRSGTRTHSLDTLSRMNIEGTALFPQILHNRGAFSCGRGRGGIRTEHIVSEGGGRRPVLVPRCQPARHRATLCQAQHIRYYIK